MLIDFSVVINLFCYVMMMIDFGGEVVYLEQDVFVFFVNGCIYIIEIKFFVSIDGCVDLIKVLVVV